MSFFTITKTFPLIFRLCVYGLLINTEKKASFMDIDDHTGSNLSINVIATELLFIYFHLVSFQLKTALRTFHQRVAVLHSL